MSTLELKNKLKEKIDKLNKDHLLEQLLEIIEFQTSDELLEIPESHKASIDRALEQIKAGHSVTNEEVLERVKQQIDK